MTAIGHSPRHDPRPLDRGTRGPTRVTARDLAPLTDARLNADDHWTGEGPARFLVPIAPLRGWVRVRAKLRVSMPSQARLYFDTGGGFHAGEQFLLAPVVGEMTIDRFVPLRQLATAIRFDPTEDAGPFVVERFSLQPMSRVRANLLAMLVNLRKTVFGGGTRSHRPSPWVGAQLLLHGQWRTFHRQLLSNAGGDIASTDYRAWLKYHQVTDPAREQMRRQVATWTDPPLISIVLPVYDVPEPYLRECLDSVLRQVYPRWELCVADDASPSPHVRAVLAEYAANDPRVKVVYRPTNGGISAASNASLALATGTFVATLDHDDVLAEHALFRVAAALVANPAVDFLYSDEDKLSPQGERSDPFFKPDWSPDYFLACMYTAHLAVYRARLVRDVGGWRSAFDGAQDYDLVLRLLDRNPRVHHVPDVLYHWRTLPSSTATGSTAKPEAQRRAQQALAEHVNGALHREAAIEDGPALGYHSVRYAVVGRPRVSVIIPTACRRVTWKDPAGRHRGWLALRCVERLRAVSSYDNLELIVLDRNDMPAELEAGLSRFGVRRLTYDCDFNWSAVNNLGAAAASGDVLLFLNDDVEPTRPDWIERMLGHAQWPEVGAVGARLLYPDQSLQHAGVFLPEANPSHPFSGFPNNHPGYYYSALVARNWVAVTGACLMSRADVFHSVGGFDPAYPLNYNDVEYCLRLGDRGLRVVYEPAADLIHHESKTRRATVGADELARLRAAWHRRYRRDPFYNPNLVPDSVEFRINAFAVPTGTEPARVG